MKVILLPLLTGLVRGFDLVQAHILAAIWQMLILVFWLPSTTLYVIWEGKLVAAWQLTPYKTLAIDFFSFEGRIKRAQKEKYSSDQDDIEIGTWFLGGVYVLLIVGLVYYFYFQPQ